MSDLAGAGQRGSARLKFIVVMLILGAVAYAGYLYVPVAYQAYLFKDVMQRSVDSASALGYQGEWVKDQLTKSAPEYDVPPDAVIAAAAQNSRMEARVQFTRPIEFPGFTYQYEFDHTAKSIQFFSPK